MKIIQVVSDSNIGGAGKVILNMLKHFDRQKIDCKIVIPKKSKLKSYIKQLDYETIEIDGLGETSLERKLIKTFVKIFRDEKPDIVHTHASLSARIAAKKLKIKTVYTRHWLGGENTNIFARIMNNYFCDAAIAVSQAASNSLIATGISEKKINIIHNGIDPLKKFSDIERRILRNKYQLEEDEFIFGTVARIEKVKGLKYFINAANLFLNYNPNAKFLIFGEGSLRNKLENYVHELRRENNIIFKGFADNTQEAYNLFDVFVLSSLQEALSLALIEAMSTGCPCISTNCSGPCEIIKDNENGMLVPIKNSKAIFEAMKFLFDNDDIREKFSVNAYNSVRKNFSASTMTNEVTKFYERLVNKNG